jgi:hypothetical protein
MKRRQFLAASLAASAATLARAGAQSVEVPKRAIIGPRQFYLLQKYQLQTGPQVALTEKYIGEALIPSLAKRGLGPVGAFRVDIGPETPALYVLIPAGSAGDAATIEMELAADPEYMKAAEPFLNAPATGPAFVRMEAELLVAFAGWPRITTPQPQGQRIFQLRTYESPSLHDHTMKVQMFHSGEFDIFKAAGFRPVFFGDRLIGTRMPSLTYMLAFNDLADLTACWDRFRADPAWKKLSTDPRFAYEPIVSNITNLILSPLSSSQI